MCPQLPQLQRLWHGIAACEVVNAPDTLAGLRAEAAQALDDAVSKGLERCGMTAVAELMQDVDFRGWR